MDISRVVYLFSFVGGTTLLVLIGMALYFGEKIREIAGALGKIAESDRLSTILTIEAKKDLDIKPEEFEPKKEQLRENMHQVLNERMEYKKGKIDEPDTWAFVILNHSGFDQFVEGDVRRKAQNALARLLTNKNIPAAKRFLTTLARNL